MGSHTFKQNGQQKSESNLLRKTVTFDICNYVMEYVLRREEMFRHLAVILKSFVALKTSKSIRKIEKVKVGINILPQNKYLILPRCPRLFRNSFQKFKKIGCLYPTNS